MCNKIVCKGRRRNPGGSDGLLLLMLAVGAVYLLSKSGAIAGPALLPSTPAVTGYISSHPGVMF